MRILMLAQFYPPMIGGEERHVRALSIELVRRGHDVAVATLWHAGMAEFEVDQGVRVYRIHGTLQRFAALFSESGHQHAPSFPDPELMRGLHRVVIQEQPHIVHAHNWLLHSFAPLKAWSNARLLLTIHDHGTRCAKKKLIYNDAPCSGPGLAKCLRCTSAHYGPAKGPLVLLTNAVMSAFERHVIDKYLFVTEASETSSRSEETSSRRE